MDTEIREKLDILIFSGQLLIHALCKVFENCVDLFIELVRQIKN